jgi:hypothetical protein
VSRLSKLVRKGAKKFEAHAKSLAPYAVGYLTGGPAGVLMVAAQQYQAKQAGVDSPDADYSGLLQTAISTSGFQNNAGLNGLIDQYRGYRDQARGLRDQYAPLVQTIRSGAQRAVVAPAATFEDPDPDPDEPEDGFYDDIGDEDEDEGDYE